jgi:hypothetical protein
MKSTNHCAPTKRPQQQQPTKKKRKIKDDYRAEITPVPPPSHKELGFNTTAVEKAVAAGPAGLRSAQRIALNYAKKYLVDAEDHWKQDSQFLRDWQTSLDARYRAHARYARRWRPRFLAALSVTHSPRLSSDYAGVQHQTAYNHRKLDPEFARQWEDAQDHAIELLHARTFQRALEGDLEPVYYMGVPVGYIRKFSDKLQIEMLRAYRPDRFKTPGQAPINIDTGNKILVLDEATRMRLIEKRRQALALMPGPDEEKEKSHSETAQLEPLTHDSSRL